MSVHHVTIAQKTKGPHMVWHSKIWNAFCDGLSQINNCSNALRFSLYTREKNRAWKNLEILHANWF